MPECGTSHRRLGWPEAFDSDDFVVFELRGALLASFPVDKLALDARAEPGDRQQPHPFCSSSSAWTVPTRWTQLADRVRQAGGTLTKEPVDVEFFAGRDAYFAEPRRQLLGDRVGVRGQPGFRRSPWRRRPRHRAMARRADQARYGPCARTGLKPASVSSRRITLRTSDVRAGLVPGAALSAEPLPSQSASATGARKHLMRRAGGSLHGTLCALGWLQCRLRAFGAAE